MKNSVHFCQVAKIIQPYVRKNSPLTLILNRTMLCNSFKFTVLNRSSKKLRSRCSKSTFCHLVSPVHYYALDWQVFLTSQIGNRVFFPFYSYHSGSLIDSTKLYIIRFDFYMPIRFPDRPHKTMAYLFSFVFTNH